MKFSETAISSRIKNHFSSLLPIHRYGRDEIVIQTNEPSDQIYLIVSGILTALHQNDEGKYLQLKRFYKDDIVGYYACLAGKPRSATVVALEETEVIKIPSKEFYKFITGDTLNTHEMISYLGGELYDQTQRYKEIGLLSVDERVASYLLRMADGGAVIEFDQSRQEIADSLGMSRETLSRALAIFQEKGHIRPLTARSFALCHKKALQDILLRSCE